MNYPKLFFLCFFLCFCRVVQAQSLDMEPEDSSDVTELPEPINFQLRAYFGIGGSTPLGIPKEIRSIKKYNPGLQLGIEINATKWLSTQWGIRTGLAIEGRGMKTTARTQNYLTEIIQDNTGLRGYYTGIVETHVNNTYLKVPVSAVYRLSSKWNLMAGLYAAVALDRQFNGLVRDGVFREGSYTGPKIIFEGDARATYDFSKNVKTFQWGTQLGGEWKMNEYFSLFSQISYGFNGALKNDFSAISFSLHNVYLDLGFAYRF